MISMSEAKSLINECSPAPQTTRLPLAKSLGRALAQDVRATASSPACDNSAMDGFAIRFEDIRPDASFKIIGESRAGIPFDGTVAAGTAVRINTGALVPVGVDTVVPVEDCEEKDREIQLTATVKAGQHIRKKGEEFTAGDLLLNKGTIIQPPQTALLAFLGLAEVEVFQSPRVSICVTGSELRYVEDSAEDFQVRDSNSPMLEAAVRSAGGKVAFITRVADDLVATTEALARAAEESDFILVTGGVSVGLHDHVKEAAARNGFEKKFWKVRQKPGKPFFFAVKGDKLLFGLPGNPVSAFINYIVYIDAIIRRLVSPNYRPAALQARIAVAVANNSDRTQLLRAFLDDLQTPPSVTPVAQQGSHMISSLTTANGYVVVAPGESIAKNESITFHPFPWRC